LSKYKWLTLIGVITMLLLVTGCSDSKSPQENNKPNTGIESKEEKPPEKLESDVDLTQQLEAEKGIERVMVQVVEGEQRSVNVDIVINDEQELTADEVVEKYSKIIKAKYPDRSLDIIVAKAGKQLKQVTLP